MNNLREDISGPDQPTIYRFFKSFEEKLRTDNAPGLLIDTFSRQYSQFLGGATGLIGGDTVGPVDSLPAYEEASRNYATGLRRIAETVVIKLNGGLGTTMGLDVPKSLLPVKKHPAGDGFLSFLDIIARQVLHLRETTGTRLPLVLMNSRSTEAASIEALQSHRQLVAGQKEIPLSFLQHRVPKIRQDNLQPVEWPEDRTKEWYPPGHGDLYLALVTTGLMDLLLDRHGIKYAFVSNADNLGATIDLGILGYFAENELPFLMEVTDRTAADSKGGHLARRKSDNRLLVRESAQCPEDEQDEFQDVSLYRFFNTNNLWLNLNSIRSFLAANEYRIDLPLIVNPKTVDPRDPQSPRVIQLETAMGAAISLFEGAQALRVPRSRFAPVKTTNDLLAVWSDAYLLTDDWNVVVSPKRTAGPPVVNLDPRYYGRIDDLGARFPAGAPSLVECDTLVVEGDLRFGRDITIKGSARIRNGRPEPVSLPDAAIISSDLEI